MEALSDALQPYKELVGSVAGIVTIGQMFSGSIICYDIYKQGSTRGHGIMPFLGGLIMGLVNLQYGFILRDSTMIVVNFCGIALSIVYLMIYFNFSSQKRDIIKNQSTEGMPFPIIASGTVVTFMWLLYGIILKSDVIVLQNVVAFSLCAVQMALFAIYPSKPKKSKGNDKAKKAE